MVKRVLVAAVCVLATGVPARAQESVRYRDEVFTEIETFSDIVYGRATNSRGEIQDLTLDLHQPRGDAAERRGVVVWVHGGYFKRGDKASDYERPHVLSFARAGYVTVSINYRLDPDLPEGAGPAVTGNRLDEYVDAMTDAQHDAQAAVRWVKANAAALRLDPERIAIAGHSAGGITATMVAFNHDDPGDSGNAGPSSRVAAAVSHAGGGLPVRHVRVDAGEPPILFVHGLRDDVVPYPSALMPCAATVAMTNVCEVVTKADQGHGLFGPEHDRAFLYRWLYDRPSARQPLAVTVVP